MNENEDILLNESELRQLEEYIKNDFVTDRISLKQLEQYADKYNIKPEDVKLIIDAKKEYFSIMQEYNQKQEQEQTSAHVYTKPPVPAPPPDFKRLAIEANLTEGDIHKAMKTMQIMVRDEENEKNQEDGERI